MTDLEHNLKHSRAAYLFAIRCLPAPNALASGPIVVNGIEFAHESQITSVLIELGWAFFCRYEACLEAFLKRSNVDLSQGLTRWLASKSIDIPRELRQGIKVYRRIRNQLHHEDGAPMNGERDQEIHILPDHMETYFDLFVWIGNQVASVTP